VKENLRATSKAEAQKKKMSILLAKRTKGVEHLMAQAEPPMMFTAPSDPSVPLAKPKDREKKPRKDLKADSMEVSKDEKSKLTRAKTETFSVSLFWFLVRSFFSLNVLSFIR
jgi:hypothetical protein